MSIIVAGPASRDLAYSTAKLANLEYVDVESKLFPDGEIKVTIADAYRLEDEDAIIIESLYPCVNERLVELFFILGKVKEHASKITLVIPYLAYARQDREFLMGESVSINHLALIFDAFKVSKFITIDIHSRLALSYIKNGVNLSAIPLLAEWFKSVEAMIISPDLGGLERAERFAALINGEAIALTKYRDRKSGAVNIAEDEDMLAKVDGKNVIIIDDMISTGGSIVKAIDTLKGRCRDIYVACVHALLVNNAYEKIMNAGVKEIVASNTIESIVSKVDVSPLIRDAII